jgi:restriction system protein
MRAWMVRAGAEGQREQQVLSGGNLLPGWTAVRADISTYDAQHALRTKLRAVYGDAKSERTLGSWAGQMWRFVNEMADGDIVVMPLKSNWGMVAIGRIVGSYIHDPSAAPGCQHTRPVEWSREIRPKDTLGPDLQASLGALPTLCELSRNDAAMRFGNVFEQGIDPQAPSSEETASDEYLARIAAEVERGEHPVASIRDLLARWGYFRRTSASIEAITTALSEYGLLAVPAITEGTIDDQIQFAADAAPETDTAEANPTREQVEVSEEQIDSAQRTSQDVVSGEIRYAVGSLPSASRDVAAVEASTSLPQALTRMAVDSYSQLAVVDEANRLIGALTWESIAMAWASGRPESVRDAMVEAQSVATSEELLSLTSRISDYGYVFVRDADGRVQGIVTAADLTQKFGDDQAPLIQLDEIEKRLGRHVRAHCSDKELAENDIRVPHNGKTLGTYVLALKRQPLWDKLGWRGVDQDMMHSLMDRVRVIRNDVMHFSPDPVTSRELETLASAMRMLRLITEDGE